MMGTETGAEEGALSGRVSSRAVLAYAWTTVVLLRLERERGTAVSAA
jgi:hypothetical protein